MKPRVVKILSRTLFSKSGFSLVEVTIALGIIAFALVGIMALFPVAMKSAQESIAETQATFIARQIFAEIQASAESGTAILHTGLTTSLINLTTPTELAIAYSDDGQVAEVSIPASGFSTPIEGGELGFVARVNITPNAPQQGLLRLDILVSTPPAAALENRTQFPFVTYLAMRNTPPEEEDDT